MNKFPLMAKAEKAGIFSCDTGCLISAPTATGKSHIGIELIKRGLPDKPAAETFLYLVPFKALAEEMFYKLQHELPSKTAVNIKTGDYDKPFNLNEADVLVATYESADGIIQEGRDFYPTLVIADEFSIIADFHRGAKIESLTAFLAKRANTRLFALSAVLQDPERVAKWLNIPVLQGGEEDRPVRLRVKCVKYTKKGDTVRRLCTKELAKGSVLVFCYTKRGTERLAFDLKSLVAQTLTSRERRVAEEYAKQLKNSFGYLVDLPELVKTGVAYHHAGLEVDLRQEIERGFRARKIKLLVATTTLSAGVNLPARTVIVRDITRFEGRRYLLSISEMVNMLGRAGRPTMDDVGIGYYLVPKDKSNQEDYKTFIGRVNRRRVERIESRIPSSSTNILHFILSVAARMRGLEKDQLMEAYNNSYWGFEKPQEPAFPRMEETSKWIEAFIEPQFGVRIESGSATVHGGVLSARGGGGDYDISISQDECVCSCPAYTYRRLSPCKHIKQLQYEAIKGEIATKNPDAKRIAIDSIEEAQLWENPSFALATGVDLLLKDSFLEEREGRLHITQDGRQALMSYSLSMEQVRILRDRMRESTSAKNEEEIISWAIEDYRENPQGRTATSRESTYGLPEILQKAVWEHITNKPHREILEQRWIQRFLEAKEGLDQIFNAYHVFCPKDRASLARKIRIARARVHYGCTEDLLPLMALEIREIGDIRTAMELSENGIRNVEELSQARERQLSGILRVTPDEAKRALEKAMSIHKLTTEFSGDRSELNTLAARTGVKTDDLLDYLLPSQMARAIREL